jgi:Ca2+-binding RTX toxin-like protein
MRGRVGGGGLIEQTIVSSLDAMTAAKTLVGGPGNDVFIGGSQADILDGAGGHDVLTGLAGSDTFVFHANFGKDTVTDLHPGEDVIQIDAALFADVAAVINAATDDGAGNVVIAYDPDNTITLQSVTRDQLQTHPGDFHLV